MSTLWRDAAGRERAQVGGPTPLPSCLCGCGCEPDGDWHWSQQPWCRCAPNGCPCVTDTHLTKQAAQSEEPCGCGQTHPTSESVRHITEHYGFADAHPSGASGQQAWEQVKDNYLLDDPHWQRFRQHLTEHGIQRPIRIDYHQSPPQVIDGHSRLVNAERMGLDRIPVRHGDWWDVHSFPDETQTRQH